MSIPNLYNGVRLDDYDLSRMEEHAYSSPDSLAKQIAAKLIVEVRRLNHELTDPRFMYASGRATRAAVVCRNVEIDELREQNRELLKTLAAAIDPKSHDDVAKARELIQRIAPALLAPKETTHGRE